MSKELTPQEIDAQSRKIKSAASVRLTSEGQPIPLPEQTRKSATAMEAFAISTANEELFRQHHTDVARESLSSVDGFQSVLKNSDPTNNVEPTCDDALARMNELIEFANKINSDLYTPFMGAESQVLMTQYVRELLSKVHESLNNPSQHEKSNPDFSIFSQPVKAEIVDSVTRAFLYPLSTPVNQPDDFDSGNCDYHLNTSFRRGDRGHIVATSGQYAFFMSDYDTYGWIDQNHAAATIDSQTKQQEMFYIGGKPLFFKTDNEHYVVLPGDSIYVENSHFVAKVRDAAGSFSLQQLPAINEKEITGELDFSQPKELQTAIDFLNNVRMPYMWSVFDCSEVVRRVFLMSGISLHKYSGDMMSDLQKISPNQSLITEAEGLSQLSDGVYVMNLLNPGKPKESQSTHMFFVVKKDGELKAFSYAFDITGDEQVEQPIGPHVCGTEALTKQLAKGRHLVVTSIAA